MTQMIPAWVDGRLMPVEKLEVHRRGLRHPAISVFVMDGDRTMLQRRALTKYHTPGLWANACCTHPYWGEDITACARRRLFEELGIAGLPLVLREQVEYRADVGQGLIEHEVVNIFLAEGGVPPIDPDPDEVMDVRWVALGDLHKEIADAPERFTPWLRIYLAEFAQRIFGATV